VSANERSLRRLRSLPAAIFRVEAPWPLGPRF
jgi:hypothetical protein